MMNIKNLDDLKNLDKMEALKNMGDGMDAKKHKKQHVCGNLVQCMCGIVMLSIGGVYYNDCDFDATTYLVVGGSIMLITNILVILAILTPMEWDDKLTKALQPVIGLVQFCIFIWGTIVVFGHYSGWSYDEQYRKQLLTPVPVDGDEVYFCAYTPFMFAFVQLILTWVLLPLICGLCCCCACLTACCACCFKGNGGDGGGAVEPAKSESAQDKEMEA